MDPQINAQPDPPNQPEPSRAAYVPEERTDLGPVVMAEFIVWLDLRQMSRERRREIHAEVDRFLHWRAACRDRRPLEISSEIWCYMQEAGHDRDSRQKSHRNSYVAMNLLLAFLAAGR